MTAGFHPDWLRPIWTLPGVGAVMTTRAGGTSAPPFDSMNIRPGQGDEPGHVAANRARLASAIGASAGFPVRPVYMNQVHGTRVIRLRAADAESTLPPDADACITTDFGVACTAQVADCMPVLFAAPGGVAAAHAGWRGLAGGVLEAALDALCEATGCSVSQVQVWFGPCIGPRRFEVGADVVAAFGADDPGAATRAAFAPGDPGAATDKWIGDLARLARLRLTARGVGSISGGEWCTVEAPSRFFSFRRDRVTGRMVACIWRERA